MKNVSMGWAVLGWAVHGAAGARERGSWRKREKHECWGKRVSEDTTPDDA